MQIKTKLNPTMDEEAVDLNKLDHAIAQTRRDLEIARQQAAEPDATPTTHGILAREVGRLGDQLRLRGDLDESEALLNEVIGLWQGLGRRRAEALATLRLALVFRAASRYNEARVLLTELLEATETHTELGAYKGFALRHRGITAWREGNQGAAISDLEAALALRLDAGARRLINNTQVALETVRATSGDLV